VNVDANGQNITNDAANEPSISIDLIDRNKMVIGWRQFDSVSSNFRQAGWDSPRMAVSPGLFPACWRTTSFRSDPVLASNDVGHFFYLSLLSSFFDNVWRSSMAASPGRIWDLRPAVTNSGSRSINTNSSGRGSNTNAGAQPGNNYGADSLGRSTDGGSTWMNPINIPTLRYGGRST